MMDKCAKEISSRSFIICIIRRKHHTPKYRVGQINLHKFQMVGITHTKRNVNICFIPSIVKICISQDIMMFYQSI